MLTFDFIYNDGSRAHRGVWHMVDGILEYEHVPEKVRRSTGEIKDWHTERCGLYQQAYNPSTGRYGLGTVCTCGHTGEVIGHYTDIHISPAYTIAKACEVACHQVSNLRTGGLRHKYGSYRTRHKDGDVVTTTDGVEKPLAVTATEFPAGPWCSRCQAKMDKLQALSTEQMDEMFKGR